MKRPRIEAFEKLCNSKSGNLTEVAKALNCTRRAVELWIKNNPKYKEVYQDCIESMVDLSETQLYNMIRGIPRIENNQFVGWMQEPNMTAIIFNLKTKGKSRGWVERQEIENIDNNSFLDILKRASQRKGVEENT